MDFKLIANALAVAARKFGRTQYVADSYGLRQLGGGSYGRAYLHGPTGLVLKLSYSLEDGSMGYMSKCAEYWRKHGKAPLGCPEVYEFGMFKDCWYAVMEKVDVGGGMGEAAAEAKESIIALCGGLGNLTIRDYSKENRVRKAVGDPWDLSWDLHGENYGYAPDGRLVIFDPFASGTHITKFSRAVKSKAQHGPSRGRWA